MCYYIMHCIIVGVTMVMHRGIQGCATGGGCLMEESESESEAEARAKG